MNNPFAETVLSGSMLLAMPVALLAGLVSFLSPCVLPLVPGYLGYVSGLSGADLQDQRRGRMFAGIGLFVLGFSVVFVLIGAVFGQLGAWLMGPDAAWVTQVLGLVVMITGGAQGLDASPLLLNNILSGSPALGLMFALAGFIGFESTVVYRSEARDPDKTIPRATYGSAILVGLFYAFGSWVIIMAAGPSKQEEKRMAEDEVVGWHH